MQALHGMKKSFVKQIIRPLQLVMNGCIAIVLPPVYMIVHFQVAVRLCTPLLQVCIYETLFTRICEPMLVFIYQSAGFNVKSSKALAGLQTTTKMQNTPYYRRATFSAAVSCHSTER
uniref:Uncharacterized protein n=1 Tax=Parascaris univalens TaxID=6257 RepID=A0A915A1D4_PARUN